MPELPDITIYVEHLARRLTGDALAATRVVSPNLLRTVDPPLECPGLGAPAAFRPASSSRDHAETRSTSSAIPRPPETHRVARP